MFTLPKFKSAPATEEKPKSLGFFDRQWKDQVVRKRLVKDLFRLVKIAQAYESNGVVKGSEPYSILYRQANSLVTCYAERYQIERKELEAQLPALLELKRLTEFDVPEIKGATLVRNLSYAGLVILGLAAIGAAVAVIQITYTYLIRHFGG